MLTSEGLDNEYTMTNSSITGFGNSSKYVSEFSLLLMLVATVFTIFEVASQYKSPVDFNTDMSQG